MKAIDIEKIIRKNFVLDESEGVFLNCHPDYSPSRDVARHVYVGLTDLYGIKPREVYGNLNISRDEYERILVGYKRRIAKTAAARENGMRLSDFTKALSTKTMLVLNKIYIDFKINSAQTIKNWGHYD